MPVRSVKNQYRGINAHLHSYWQAEGGWKGFHTNHIGDLMRAFQKALLPLGYVAEIEESLQIRHLDAPVGKPESDVTIYDPDSACWGKPSVLTDAAAVVVNIPELVEIEELSPYWAIGVYKADREKGEPTAWVELLSPSNKPHSQDAPLYREKRLKLLDSGVVFVELDYLHETPPTFSRLPFYPKQAGSFPYRIVVIDPHPDFEAGKAYLHQFGVDQPIPSVKIPLHAGDILYFDFDTPYQKTLEETFYAYWEVDYSRLPLNFDHYSPDDQLRILTRMLTVLHAAQAGKDLEQAPLPITLEGLTLESALAQLESYTEATL